MPRQSTVEQPLECRFPGVVDFPGDTPPKQFMFMPGGNHRISVSQGGRPIAVNVRVDRDTAATLQQALDAHFAGPQKPWFDFDHEKNSASAWPVAFVWKESPKPGVYVSVQWSRSGADAINGKDYRSFSPSFFVDDPAANPARVIGAPINMGGLVNDPAFRDMDPLWAKHAGSLSSQPQTPPHTMPPESTGELENLQAENDRLKTELQAKRKTDAKTAVDAAVMRGALPPKNFALLAKWSQTIEDDPTKIELLASMPAHPALSTVTKPEGTRSRVEMVQTSYDDALRGYLEARTPRDKGWIFRREINARLDKGENIPFCDLESRLPLDAVNTLGTLVGNIVTQRTLALVYAKRPMLSAFVTDFSDQGAYLNQAIKTRLVGLPTVQDFGTAPSARSDTDYTVTLDQFKQVQFSLLATDYMATSRDLVREESEALAVALGNYLVDFVAALITTAFTSQTVVAAGAFDYATLITINSALNTAGVPDTGRFALVNTDIAGSMRQDEVVMANFNRQEASAYARWKNIEGFEEVFEYPSLPTTSNLTGFFFQRNALILAARVPIDPARLIGAGYPGRLQTVTDPVTNLSVISNQWITQDTLAINDRLLTIFGASRGVLTCGNRTVTS